MKHTSKTLIALAIAAATSQAHAAGFQLNSQSATGIGRAFAGDAVIADNASVLSRNPAAMAMFDRPSLSLGAAYVDLDVQVKNASYNGVLGGLENTGSGNAGTSKVIPNIYYIHPINDKWAVGAAAFTNFGTGTDTSGLGASGLAHQYVGETEVITMNFNFSASYRINEQFSVGAGVDFIYGEGKISRGNPEINFPGMGNIPPLVIEQDLMNVDADGWAVGGIVGATYEVNDNHRFGMSYRFSPTFTAKGTVEKFGESGLSEIDVPMPDVFQFAGYHRVAPKVAVHYTAQWTSWSDFDAITSSGASDSIKNYHWDDSWMLSFGATYYLTPSWELRAGYMYDQGVVGSSAEESISIPDSDRDWYTAGATWHIDQKSSLDFGLAVIRGKEESVTEQGILSNLTATTRSNAVYYSMQYSRSF